MRHPENAAAPGGYTEGERANSLAGCDHSTADSYAERATVGAILIGAPRYQTDILNAVADDDFLDVRCRFVVGVVRRMVGGGTPVDCVTVPAFVESHALPDPGVGSLAVALWELGNAAPVPASGTYYAAAVMQAAVRRRAVDRLRTLARLYQSGDVDQLDDAVQSTFAALSTELDRVRPPAAMKTVA